MLKQKLGHLEWEIEVSLSWNEFGDISSTKLFLQLQQLCHFRFIQLQLLHYRSHTCAVLGSRASGLIWKLQLMNSAFHWYSHGQRPIPPIQLKCPFFLVIVCNSGIPFLCFLFILVINTANSIIFLPLALNPILDFLLYCM